VSCRSIWENGSSRAPNFEVIARTRFAIAQIVPTAAQHGDPIGPAELVRANTTASSR
jgi:hypothetical protein